jgi:hypothetical protein
MSGPKFAAPLPPSVSIPEAIALVSPPLDAQQARQALANALVNGVVRSTDAQPQLFWQAYDPHMHMLELQGVSRADLDAIAALARGRNIPPSSWHVWFAAGSVDSGSGQVIRHWEGCRPPLGVFNPLLVRADVERYFAAPEASTAQAVEQEPPTDLADSAAREDASEQPLPTGSAAAPRLKDTNDETILRAVRAVYARYGDGEGPNIKDIVALVKQHLQAQGYKASWERIQKAAGSEEFDTKRREPGKHR